MFLEQVEISPYVVIPRGECVQLPIWSNTAIAEPGDVGLVLEKTAHDVIFLLGSEVFFLNRYDAECACKEY